MILRSLLALTLSFLMASCTPEPPTFKIGTNIWPGYELLYLAREMGYLPNNVKLIEFASSTDTIEGLRSGSLDAGALTLDEALLAQQDGTVLTVPLIFDFSHGADQVYATAAVTSLNDIKGKTIALETTAVGSLMLQSLLDKAKLSVQDVKLSYIELPNQRKALEEGKADIFITFFPFSNQLAAQGAKLIFDSRDIPKLISDLLVVRNDRITIQNETLKGLINAYYKAYRLYQTEPEQARLIMNQRLRLNSTALTQAFDSIEIVSLEENKRLLSGKPSLFSMTSKELAQFLVKKELIQIEPNLESFTSAQWLPE